MILRGNYEKMSIKRKHREGGGGKPSSIERIFFCNFNKKRIGKASKRKPILGKTNGPKWYCPLIGKVGLFF